MNFKEEEYKKKAEKEILKCRPGDWNHAQRVVKWVKELGTGREDLDLIIITAYIHDIGWRDIIKKDRITFDELLEHEDEANSNSEKFVTDFLTPLGYSVDEIQIVNRLIRAADKHESNESDEEIIVDSDNLSKLDINHMKEKYERSEWIRLLNRFKKDFPKRIGTEKGKSLLGGLLQSFESSIKKELNIK